MAHAINKMIYVGEVPWHGLGVRLPARASYDEIVAAADFYEAVERPVFIPPFNAPIPDKKPLVRGDTGQYLSVVGKSYEVVQTPAAQVIDLDRTAEDQAEFLRVAIGVMRGVDAGVFVPVRSWACRGCPYAHVCRRTRPKPAREA